jgi:hypothetical protein
MLLTVRHLPKNQHHSHLQFPVFAVVTSGPLVAFSPSSVTLKIEKTIDRRRTTVRLIGRVRAEYLVELTRQLEASGTGALPQLDKLTWWMWSLFQNRVRRRAWGSSTAHHTAWSQTIEVTQDKINHFADVTGDHQWIHVDIERANARVRSKDRSRTAS